MTALRLTPISPAICRHDRPASKWVFRSSIRSSVQVGSLAGILKVPKYEPSRRLPQRPLHRRSSRPNAASRCLAVVADRQQPVLDGEANTFLDQGSGNAWYARPVSSLSDQLFEIDD